VFPGVPGDAPYEADAEPQPTNLYGQTKLDGERAVLDALKEVGKEGLGVVLRVPVLYGNAETPAESAVNVLMDVLWKAQTEGAQISMDHWAIRYPTNTEDIGRVCHGMSHIPFATMFRSKSRHALNKFCHDLLRTHTYETEIR
jgi:dTDP-4-dehydrorhamnose reductase